MMGLECTTEGEDVNLGQSRSARYQEILLHAQNLSQPLDFDSIVTRFDEGSLWLGDVSQVCSSDRDLILQCSPQLVNEAGTAVSFEDTLVAVYRSLTAPLAQYFSEIPDTSFGLNAGYKFLRNASVAVRNGVPSAQLLNHAVIQSSQDLFGEALTLPEFVSELQEGRERGEMMSCAQKAQKMILHLANSREHIGTMGYYLAERSYNGQAYQTEMYADALIEAKKLVAAQLLELRNTGMIQDAEYNRASNQLQRIDFSAFDHLIFGITVEESEAQGRIIQNALRVQAHFPGTNGEYFQLTYEQAVRILVHELFHGCSAQDPNNTHRRGLHWRNAEDQLGFDGTEVDEGMTELLCQRARGMPDTVITPEGLKFNQEYHLETQSMYELHAKDVERARVLCGAYFGQFVEQEKLSEAMIEFYCNFDALSASSERLRRGRYPSL